MTIKTRNIADDSVTAAKIAADAVVAGKIAAATITMAKGTTTMRVGFVELPLSQWRIVETAAPNDQLAAIAGTPVYGTTAKNSVPIFERADGATDKALRLRWAANAVIQVAHDFVYPPDLDASAAVEFHMLAAMSAGPVNTPLMGVSYFEGVGDTNAGTNTAAITGATVAEYTVSIAAGDVGAAPNAASVGLIPAAHATDAIYVYATWIEYTRL